MTARKRATLTMGIEGDQDLVGQALLHIPARTAGIHVMESERPNRRTPRDDAPVRLLQVARERIAAGALITLIRPIGCGGPSFRSEFALFSTVHLARH
jgi:hypothetical protein